MKYFNAEMYAIPLYENMKELHIREDRKSTKDEGVNKRTIKTLKIFDSVIKFGKKNRCCNFYSLICSKWLFHS